MSDELKKAAERMEVGAFPKSRWTLKACRWPGGAT